MSAFRIDDLPIESKMLTGALDGAQRKVEAYFFDIRKQLFEYDQVLNTQRDRVYAERRRALLAKSLTPVMLDYARKTVDDILEVGICVMRPGDAGSGGLLLWRGTWTGQGSMELAPHQTCIPPALNPLCSRQTWIPAPRKMAGRWRLWPPRCCSTAPS